MTAISTKSLDYLAAIGVFTGEAKELGFRSDRMPNFVAVKSARTGQSRPFRKILAEADHADYADLTSGSSLMLRIYF